MSVSKLLNTFYLTQKSDTSPFKELPVDLLPIIQTYVCESEFTSLKHNFCLAMEYGDVLLIKYINKYHHDELMNYHNNNFNLIALAARNDIKIVK